MYVEYNEKNKLWFVHYDDGSLYDLQGYKTRGWATRTLNEFIRHMKQKGLYWYD